MITKYIAIVKINKQEHYYFYEKYFDNVIDEQSAMRKAMEQFPGAKIKIIEWKYNDN